MSATQDPMAAAAAAAAKAKAETKADSPKVKFVRTTTGQNLRDPYSKVLVTTAGCEVIMNGWLQAQLDAKVLEECSKPLPVSSGQEKKA